MLAALEAGKHVLCEKPLGLDAAQVATMTAAASGRRPPAGRGVVEPVAPAHAPRRGAARRRSRARSEATAWFTFSGVPQDNYRLDPARGGGALYDVGCYGVAAALMALGDDVEVTAAASTSASSGVDLTTTAELASARGVARVTASFEREESQGFTVTAPGVLARAAAPGLHRVARGHHDDRRRRRGQSAVEEFDACDPYLLMVEAVSARIRGGDEWVLPLSTSLAVARTLDAVRERARP